MKIIIVFILFVLITAIGYFGNVKMKEDKVILENKTSNDFLHQQIEALVKCEKDGHEKEGADAIEMYKRWLGKHYLNALKDENFILDHQSEEGIIKYLGKIPTRDDRR